LGRDQSDLEEREVTGRLDLISGVIGAGENSLQLYLAMASIFPAKT
jgi:hypothetical protein